MDKFKFNNYQKMVAEVKATGVYVPHGISEAKLVQLYNLWCMPRKWEN